MEIELSLWKLRVMADIVLVKNAAEVHFDDGSVFEIRIVGLNEIRIDAVHSPDMQMLVKPLSEGQIKCKITTRP